MFNNHLVNTIKSLLIEVLKFQSPTDKLLSNFFRNNKRLGSQDRHIIAETIYYIVRNYYKLTNKFNKEYSKIIGFAWLNLFQPTKEQLKYVTCIEFDDLRNQKLNQELIELPEWIINKLNNQSIIGDIKEFSERISTLAPLDLRVNLIKTNVGKVIEDFKKDGLFPELTALSPFGIRLYSKSFLVNHPLFNSGHIEVQDESSQVAGMLLNPKRSEMLVDFCAGSGGKTLLFGMLMQNSGRIYAFDVNPKRLNNLAPRLKRSGLSNVYPQLIDHENDIKVKRLYNKIDKVFVDAPCTGLGTLRRNPDLKFRQTEATLSEIIKKQASILEAASRLVKAGGFLVYATCSILREENHDVVEQFLEKNPNFTRIPVANVLNNPTLKRDDGFLLLLPHIHKTDGFFAALLQRT